MISAFFKEMDKLANVLMDEAHAPRVNGLVTNRIATTSAARGASAGVAPKGRPNAINLGSGNWAKIGNLSSMDTQGMMATTLGAAALTAGAIQAPRMIRSIQKNYQGDPEAEGVSPATLYMSGQVAQGASKALQPALRRVLS